MASPQWLRHVRICAGILLVTMAISGARSTAQVHVLTESQPGATTAELVPKLKEALKQRKPQVVVLFAGMNDAVNDRKFIPPVQTAANLLEMVHDSEASGAKVLLVTLHVPDVKRLMQRHSPAAYGNDPPQHRIKEANAVIEQVARETGVTLVPFGERLRHAGGATPEWSTDGVHLTAKGYALLARTIRQKLPANLPSNVTILCVGDSLTYGIGVRSPHAPPTPQTYPSQLEHMLQRP